MIPIYRPYFPSGSLKYAHDALDSSWVSSRGKYLDLVENKLKELFNIKYVVLTSNGTTATHLVSRSLHHKYAKINKIITSNNCYIAAWNSFLFDNFYDLYITDSDLNTWNFDIGKYGHLLEEKNICFLVIHNVGNILDVIEIKKKYPNIVIVEDNCEGLLGKYQGKYSGTESLASSVSFFGNKNITCGEGGALLTNDLEVYEFASCLNGQGQSNIKFLHHELGYNYRMTNVEAAILLGQLEVLDEILENKYIIFEKYKSSFKENDNILIQRVEESTAPSNWIFAIRTPGGSYKNAKKFFDNLSIDTRPLFYPASCHYHINNHAHVNILEEDNSKILSNECIMLPSYPSLTSSEQNFIIKSVKEYVVNLK